MFYIKLKNLPVWANAEFSAKFYNYEYNAYKYKNNLITNVSILALDPLQCETRLEDRRRKALS